MIDKPHEKPRTEGRVADAYDIAARRGWPVIVLTVCDHMGTVGTTLVMSRGATKKMLQDVADALHKSAENLPT